jgi:hypothetical protein
MEAEHGVQCECGQCGSPESAMVHERLGHCVGGVATALRADLAIVFAAQRGRDGFVPGMSAVAELRASRASRMAGARMLRADAFTIERTAADAAVLFESCPCVAHHNVATASQAIVADLDADVVVVCALRRNGRGFAASAVAEVLPAAPAARAETVRMMRQVADALEAARDGAIRMAL